MYPLIEITSIPIKIEFKTTNAKLECTQSTAELEVKRNKGGGLNIKSKPIKVNIDTYEARNSVLPTVVTKLKQNAESGKQTAYEATATYAQQGKLLLNAKVGEELITQFAHDAMFKDVKPNVGIQFLPDRPVEFDWDMGEMNIRYEMDKLNFDWRTNQYPSFEFTPATFR